MKGETLVGRVNESLAEAVRSQNGDFVLNALKELALAYKDECTCGRSVSGWIDNHFLDEMSDGLISIDPSGTYITLYLQKKQELHAKELFSLIQGVLGATRDESSIVKKDNESYWVNPKGLAVGIKP